MSEISANRKCKITRKEFVYLTNAAWLPAEVKQAFAQPSPVGRKEFEFELESELVTTIGDLLTQRLARCGFDINYDPSDEGLLLESLIDKFSRLL